MSDIAELERLSDLIDFIYRGATEPTLWPDIVASASDWLGSPKGMLYTPLHGHEQGGFYFQHGLPDFFLDLYKARYQAVDMWTREAVARNAFIEGNVIIGTDLVPHSVLIRSQWHQECLQFGGISRLLTSIIFGTEASSIGSRIPNLPTVCSFYRGEDGPEYSEGDRRRLALLLPHFSRALGVMSRLQSSEFRVAASLSALDRLPSAVLLLTESGDALFSNRPATAMFSNAEVLRFDRTISKVGLGRLVSLQPETNREIARALSAAREIHDVAHFSTVVKIPGRVTGRDWLLQLSRVRMGAAFQTDGPLPEVIAFLTDTSRPVDVDPDLLMRTYGLTPAEARVASAATAIGSVEELAQALSLRANTVKTQLKQVYAKTRVTSRAELVRVMLGLAAGS